MLYARNKVLSFMTKYKDMLQKQPNLSLVFLVSHCSYVSKMVKSFWNFFYWKGLWECFLSHFLILWLIISFYAHSKTPSDDGNSFFMMDINYRECVFFFVHEFEGWDILHKKMSKVLAFNYYIFDAELSMETGRSSQIKLNTLSQNGSSTLLMCKILCADRNFLWSNHHSHYNANLT